MFLGYLITNFFYSMGRCVPLLAGFCGSWTLYATKYKEGFIGNAI